MLVRFKPEYSADLNNRLSYELVSDEPECFYLDKPYGVREYEEFYNVKLLGWIPSYKMEITTDTTDTPAIEIFIQLANQQSK